MIYLDQVSLDKIYRLLEEQKASNEILHQIGKRLKARRQFFAPAVTTIRPKKIVNTAEETPRPPIISVETENVVGLEENIQVSEPKIDSEEYSSKECSNDEQGQDRGLVSKIMPLDMIIGDEADMEKSRSAKLFELKAEIGEIIMPGGHNNCSTHSATDNKFFAKLKIFGENPLFGREQNQFENFDINLSRLGIKHRWPPPLY